MLASALISGVFSELTEDPYRVLRVSRTADERTIKARYREELAAHHPDKNDSPGAEDAYLRIQEAYEILGDPHKRREYDTYGHGGARAAGWGGARSSDGFSRAVYLTWDNFAAFITDGDPDELWLILVYVNGPLSAWDALADEIGSIARYGRVNAREQRHLAGQLGVDYVPAIVGSVRGQFRLIARGIDSRAVQSWVQSNMGTAHVPVVSSPGDTERQLAALAADGPVMLVVSAKDSPSMLTRSVARQLAGDVTVLHVVLRAGAMASALEPLLGDATSAIALVTAATGSSLAELLVAATVYDGARDAGAIVRWAWELQRWAALPRVTTDRLFTVCLVRCALVFPDGGEHDAAVVAQLRRSLAGQPSGDVSIAPTDRFGLVTPGELDPVRRAVGAQASTLVLIDRAANRCVRLPLEKAAALVAPRDWLRVTIRDDDSSYACSLDVDLSARSVVWAVVGAVQWVMATVRSVVSTVMMLGSTLVFVLLFVRPLLAL